MSEADNNLPHDLISCGCLFFGGCRKEGNLLIDCKNAVRICITPGVPFSAAGSLDQDVLTHYSGPSSADGTNFFFHQLIKIQDNESKHARSNSLQDWRQDVNFHARAHRRNHKYSLLRFI